LDIWDFLPGEKNPAYGPVLNLGCMFISQAFTEYTTDQ
jgi:hypothetical protein